MAKKEDTDWRGRPRHYRIGGMVLVGCILLGLGIGVLVDAAGAGVLIGIGVGFLAMAAIHAIYMHKV